MYLCAEGVHSSGVLAVVSGGLLLSSKRHLFLNSTARLHGVNVWESFCFILNGLVFMLIGLDLPEITAGLEGVSTSSAIGYGLLITVVLIASRILSAYGAVMVTLIARNFITVADSRNPGYKVPFVLGWTGMRGVVSLAAALSIPVYMPNGTAFPQRNLILFITFIVILLTLLVQGLTLPYLIRKIQIPNLDQTLSEDEAHHIIMKELAEHALIHLKNRYSEQLSSQPVLQQMALNWEQNVSVEYDELITQECKLVYLDILNQQRQWLIQKNNDEKMLDEEIIRKHLRYLDMEEEKLNFL